MNIHEYQAKGLLKKFGVAVPEGHPAFSVPEAVEAAKALESADHKVFVVKAQIHAGGRGKAGGVKVVKSTEEVREKAQHMLGMKMITHQTGPEGKIVKRLYVESGSNIKKEYYLSAVVDRKTKTITFMASTEGGVEIEEVATTTPEKIISVRIDPASGIQACHARKLGFALGFKGDLLKKFSKLVFSLYDAFNKTDASQIEINPLVETAEGEIIALDAKINFDDNALHRHDNIREMRDLDEEEPLEIEASKYDLSYIKMDGQIGCMVNGAGLAMATMDIIKLYGSSPANFLDVGGGATREKVTAAFKIILSDSSVRGILVNIFGGIMRCDVIANGILEAAKEVNLSVPLVVRLEGTNVDLGKDILAKSGLSIIAANDLADAAEKIVKAVKTAELN
ncbi:MAG: ADP-forming succinate--CoA ligase subunit beta [Alphaproteobacteria bacterium]|nr:ADP-forming succinate--CoA ligase subunit beta [Alphaproteobacteria bacterium]